MSDLLKDFPEFGSKLRETDFVLEEGYTFINNGYMGAVPKSVIAAEQKLRDRVKRQPSSTVIRNKIPEWTNSRNVVADFLNADPSDIVLVPNATTAISTLLMSVPINTGDTILITNHTYASTHNACAHILEHHKGVKTEVLRISIPIKDTAQVIDLFHYVSCGCAMQLPVTEIVQLCQKYNTITIVDGAHWPGQFPVSLRDVEADFFFGNFHKWMFAPWGCAFVWKNKRVTFPLRSLLSSSPTYDLVTQFCLQGTKDDSNYGSIPAAVEYFKSKGGLERISGYNTRLLQMASEYLVSLWQTSKLDIPTSMEPPFIRMIRLPKINGFGTSEEDAMALTDILFFDYRIDASLKSIQNQLYARVSVQIYNCMQDYETYGKAIMSIAEKRHTFIKNENN
ncbi:uncharacterized protein [Argopecten irradians]|uniref:uncharacterized protein isoform X2 n=1 Tax=Argopecten irradians TaxID=31199 RepID=UPI00371025CA